MMELWPKPAPQTRGFQKRAAKWFCGIFPAGLESISHHSRQPPFRGETAQEPPAQTLVEGSGASRAGAAVWQPHQTEGAGSSSESLAMGDRGLIVCSRTETNTRRSFCQAGEGGLALALTHHHPKSPTESGSLYKICGKKILGCFEAPLKNALLGEATPMVDSTPSCCSWCGTHVFPYGVAPQRAPRFTLITGFFAIHNASGDGSVDPGQGSI